MDVKALIVAEAQRQGIDPAIALAVAAQESGFNQAARSPVGAIGVMQLMPGTAAGLGVDPYDTAQNIRGGITYLRQQYSRFGNWTQALQAYNGGPAHVNHGDVSQAAQLYASQVLARTATYGGYAGSSSPAWPDLAPALTWPGSSEELSPYTVAAVVIGLAAAALVL